MSPLIRVGDAGWWEFELTVVVVAVVVRREGVGRSSCRAGGRSAREHWAR